MNEAELPRADIVGGPIEMSGYDYFYLVVDHTAVFPDGRMTQVPAGTKLIMNTGGGGTGIRYDNGTAAKGCTGDYTPPPSA